MIRRSPATVLSRPRRRSPDRRYRLPAFRTAVNHSGLGPTPRPGPVSHGLPTAPAPDATPVPDALVSLWTQAPHGTETVLLVEDQQSVRALARHVLELTGYRVLEAASGPDALRIAAQYPHAIALLLTDVVMPCMNGREVADRLAGLRPATRVLYMSGYTDDALGDDGLAPPRIAFLPKPFTPIALARKVREVLDR